MNEPGKHGSRAERPRSRHQLWSAVWGSVLEASGGRFRGQDATLLGRQEGGMWQNLPLSVFIVRAKKMVQGEERGGLGPLTAAPLSPFPGQETGGHTWDLSCSGLPGESGLAGPVLGRASPQDWGALTASCCSVCLGLLRLLSHCPRGHCPAPLHASPPFHKTPGPGLWILSLTCGSVTGVGPITSKNSAPLDLERGSRRQQRPQQSLGVDRSGREPVGQAGEVG